MRRGALIGAVGKEFADAQLGDARRERRLVALGEALAREPSRSFPQAFDTEAEVEAFYRFVNNDGFTFDEMSTPHRSATAARVAKRGLAVAIHDSTSVEFDAVVPREGMGWTTAKHRQGFYVHASLLLTPEAIPLGVGHLETWTRSGKKRRGREDTHRVMREDRHRESLRWLRGVDAIETLCGDDAEIVHVTDAEGDFFEFFARFEAGRTRFVIRAGQLDRIVLVDGVEKSLREAIANVAPRLHRRIELSPRRHIKRRVAHGTRKRHPTRSARTARVAIGATTVQLRKTKYTDVAIAPFDVNVVRVWEPAPVAGEPPVEWVLLTCEPVKSMRAIARVVDLYRLRWTIEEYFKALKTGCALEKRQTESYDALRKVLALLAPIANRLLLLRALERTHPDEDARVVFTRTELTVLAAGDAEIPASPLSVRDALTRLARLGGHLKNNGPPGWLTLGRGHDRLALVALGWRLARKNGANSDR